MNDTVFTKRPAVRVALLLILGILVANQLQLHSSYVLVVFVVLFFLSAASTVLGRTSIVSDLSLQVLVIALGSYFQSIQQESTSNSVLDPAQEESILIDARIESEPVRQEKKTTFVLKTYTLRRAGQDDFTEHRILTTLRGGGGKSGISMLRCGTRLTVRATLAPYPKQRNPGEFNYGRYLALNNIQGIATIAQQDDLVVTGEAPMSNFSAFIGSMQRILYGIIDHYHSPQQASFLKGVILGYRADLSTEIKQSFMNTGTIHILAVSGSNVAVIVLIFYSMFGFFRLPKKIAGIATIIGIVIFMFITGASPSVVRASIMATVILVGTMFERKVDVYNSLGVAAIIILLMDTNSLFDVGFQLSFAAVISIVYFYPILTKLINLIPERFEEIKVIDYLLKLFAVSLAAQIGTLPFTAFYFGRVSLVSLLANLIVVPLSGVNVLLGVATVAVSSFSSFIASCYGALNSIAMDFLLGFVKVAGDVPYAYVETARFEPLHALIYYGLVGTLFHFTNPRIVKWGILISLTSLSLFFFKAIVQHRSGVLTITVIDVGQGDAVLLQLPNGKNILIDGGPRQFKYDAGERIITPFLKRNGIASLDAILITHSHGDHIGGIPFITGHERVASLMEADVQASSSLYRNLKDLIRREGILHFEIKKGQRIALDSSVRLYVLHPKLPEDIHNSLNNTSVVVKLEYGDVSMLLVGDADNEAELKMCMRYGGFLSSDILKVGHHGSNTSSGDEFLRCVKPAYALISVGAKNKFGHPSQEIIARLKRYGSHVARTDKEGALVFESDGHVWWRSHWRTNKESLQVIEPR